MSKTYYVSSGDVSKEIQADSPLDACKKIVEQVLTGDNLGLIMRVSDKGFKGDRNPWYIATEVVIKAVGHKIERISQ